MTDTRERLLSVSAGLFRRQGYAGTGLKRVVADAGAQMGSLYHFFPGGKEELATAVIHWSAERQAAYLDSFFDDSTDPAQAIDGFFKDAARSLRDSAYTEACPITMLALEAADTSETLRRAAAEAFDRWAATLARHLADGGIPAATARALALTALAGIEGAFVLCRASRTCEALEVTRVSTVAAIQAALPTKPAQPR